MASSLSRIHDRNHTRHNRQESSGQVFSPTHRILSDNTQHPLQTNIHAPSEIRSHNPSKRAATDLRHRPLGHWDRQTASYGFVKLGNKPPEGFMWDERNLIVCEVQIQERLKERIDETDVKFNKAHTVLTILKTSPTQINVIHIQYCRSLYHYINLVIYHLQNV